MNRFLPQLLSLRTAVFFLIICLLSSCKFFLTSIKEDIPPRHFRVTKVVDGDTFWVDNHSENGLKIRLIGVDAPESKKNFGREIGYFGFEAKVYLTDLLEDQIVRLERDVDSLDRYGRTLSYVYLEDGTFVNAELVENGFARIMTIPPNVSFADVFYQLQLDAKRKRIGLWE